MADFFNKMKKSLNKGTTVISVKSSTMMETNKLKGEISSLKKERTDIFTATGEKYYMMKKEGNLNYQELDELIARAFELDQNVLEKEAAIEEAIRKQEETIKALEAGEEAEEESEANQSYDGVVCVCGEVLPEGTKFCPKCGNNISANIEQPAEEVEADSEETITCDCGAVLKAGTVFCAQCGKKLN